MRRTWVLAIAAGCSAAPRAASPGAAAPGVAAGSQPVASSAGSSAPWPAPTSVPAPSLRLQTRPLPHDLVQLRTVGDVAISPDGARVAYTVRAPRFDPAAKPSPDDARAGWKVETQLYVVDRAGGAPRQLTFGDDPVSSPRFSPDGRSLAFLRRKGGKPAIHVMDLGGGEPYEREWEQTHLFVVPIAGGEPRHVNRGTDTILMYRWSPDGRRFALVVAPSSDPAEMAANQRLVVVDAADGGNPQELARGDGGPAVIPAIAWSPDARRVAYAITLRGGLSHIDELRVRPLDGSPAINAAARLDPTLLGLAWTGDGKALLATALARTSTKLYRLPLDGRAPAEVPLGRRVLVSFEADRAGRYVAGAAGTPELPPEPTLIDTERGTAASLAALHPQLRDWMTARSEVFAWKNRE